MVSTKICITSLTFAVKVENSVRCAKEDVMMKNTVKWDTSKRRVIGVLGMFITRTLATPHTMVTQTLNPGLMSVCVALIKQLSLKSDSHE